MKACSRGYYSIVVVIISYRAILDLKSKVSLSLSHTHTITHTHIESEWLTFANVKYSYYVVGKCPRCCVIKISYVIFPIQREVTQL